MTSIEPSDRGHASQGDRWRILVAMLVYAAGVSIFQARSMSVLASPGSGDAADLFMTGYTFFSIVTYAVGFMLLAGLLDIWTGRRAQPLAAMNLALPAIATFELFKLPLLVLGFQVWFWVTRAVQ